jgi:hypothetical protein
MGDPKQLEKGHRAIREAAKRHTIEEALHGLAATAAEVIIAAAPPHERQKLLTIFITMVVDFRTVAERDESWLNKAAHQQNGESVQ